jgi:Ca2+-binding RTX toxin-like protein
VAQGVWERRSKNTLYGGPGRDFLAGADEGDDVIYGGDGDDEILWGVGARMYSTAGMATIIRRDLSRRAAGQALLR